MNRLATLIALACFTTPAFADQHCPQPKTTLPYHDVIRAGREGPSYTQAFELTHRAALQNHKSGTVATCEADPANFNVRCDIEDYPTFDDVDPQFLGLSEAEYDQLIQEMSDESYALNQRLEACILEGSDKADG